MRIGFLSLFISFAMSLNIAVADEQAADTDSQADAEEQPAFTVDLTADLFSAYMFRGFNLYDGTVFQPSIKANYSLGDLGEISAVFWHSEGVRNKAHVTNYSEIDYSISYTKEIDSLSIGLGNLWYTYPRGEVEGVPATREFYVSLSYDTFLYPTLTLYHDYDSYDNQYYELGVSHEFETGLIADGLNILPYATAGFASNAEKVYADNGLEQFTAGINLEIYIGDLTIRPSIHKAFKVDDNTVNKFWSGLSLSYSF